MTPIQAFGLLVALLLLLFGVIYWLSNLSPSNDAPGEEDESGRHHPSHSSSDDGPTIGPV